MAITDERSGAAGGGTRVRFPDNREADCVAHHASADGALDHVRLHQRWHEGPSSVCQRPRALAPGPLRVDGAGFACGGVSLSLLKQAMRARLRRPPLDQGLALLCPAAGHSSNCCSPRSCDRPKADDVAELLGISVARGLLESLNHPAAYVSLIAQYSLFRSEIVLFVFESLEPDSAPASVVAAIHAAESSRTGVVFARHQPGPVARDRSHSQSHSVAEVFDTAAPLVAARSSHSPS